jgi:hypothetical protein
MFDQKRNSVLLCLTQSSIQIYAHDHDRQSPNWDKEKT